MADSFFVDATTARPFFIKGRPGYWPEMRGHYRPLGVKGQLDWLNRMNHTSPELVADLECNTVASQLIDWNCGRQVTPDSVLKLDGELYLLLRNIVCYGAPSDPDPKSNQLPKSDAEDVAEKKSDSPTASST
jgi:hypothetical protein